MQSETKLAVFQKENKILVPRKVYTRIESKSPELSFPKIFTNIYFLMEDWNVRR